MAVFLLLCHPVTGPGAADPGGIQLSELQSDDADPGGVQRPGAPIWTAGTEAESIQDPRIWQPGSVPAGLMSDLTRDNSGAVLVPLGVYASHSHPSIKGKRPADLVARDGETAAFVSPRHENGRGKPLLFCLRDGQKSGPWIVKNRRTNRTPCNHNWKTAKNTKLRRFQTDSNITVISVTTVTKNDDSGKWKLSQPVTETVTSWKKPVKKSAKTPQKGREK